MRWPLALVLLLFALPAQAEWVGGRAERVFGPDTAEAEACHAARDKARQTALTARLGERVTAEDRMLCTEGQGDADCSLHSATWSVVDGAIRAVRDERTTVTAGPAPGFHVCSVSLEADIGTANGQPDPGFDLGVTLGGGVLHDGDTLSLGLEPSAPMHVAVFQWLPYDRSATPVTRIFPNAFDSDDLFRKSGTIPTIGGAARYSLVVSFPETVPPGTRMVDEYLLVVASKSKIAFRDQYGLDELTARLLEIPRSDSRLIKRGYAVVRAP